MDQPLGDPSVLPTWAVARMAARHVPVVLTGEAGTSCSRLPTYLGHAHASLVRALPPMVRNGLLALARRMRPKHTHVSMRASPSASCRLPRCARSSATWRGSAPRARSEARGLLAPALRGRLGEDDPLAHLDRVTHDLREAPVGDLERDPRLVAYQLFDFETYLSGLLTKVDRSTMAHGLESRAPFLRHALIEHAMRLPASLKLRGTTGKWVLKRLARTLLPREVLTRRKQGFSPPFTVWSRGRCAPRCARGWRRAAGARGRARSGGGHAPARVPPRRPRRARPHAVDRAQLQMWAEEWVAGRASAGSDARSRKRERQDD